MLKFLFAACLLFLAVSANADEFDIASRMADSGAEALALSYMESCPIPKPDLKWASLKIALLSKFGKSEKVLEAAKELPFSVKTANLAISAAFSLSKPTVARDWLAKLIWKGHLSKAELRQARLEVIRTYVMGKDGKSGYYAMLRFDQDYHPLSKAEAHEFVSGLASLGMAKDAVPWLIFLDDRDAAKIMAELETGLISPDEAVKNADGDPEILLEAAKLKKDPSLEIEAEEKLLSEGRIQADVLWKSYLDHAIAYSNRYALLQGDYGSWPDSISKIPDVFARRSLLAYLSAKDPKALPALVDSLKNEPKVAIALFSRSSLPDPDTAAILGKMAFQEGNYADCAGYWAGLKLPQDALPELAIALMKTGKADGAASTLLQYLKGEKTLDSRTAGLILPLADELAGAKVHDAKTILSALLPLVDAESRQDVLMLLGKYSEDPKEAAAWYFQASFLSPKPDEISKKAKLALISSLKQAGFAEDAKALEK
ncbi:MAG TPA: hypothetical protein PLK99_00690 [Burkholderiales bacterium]|nr:hypothetical protein [Burkholderiales bacterium]